MAAASYLRSISTTPLYMSLMCQARHGADSLHALLQTGDTTPAPRAAQHRYMQAFVLDYLSWRDSACCGSVWQVTAVENAHHCSRPWDDLFLTMLTVRAFGLVVYSERS